jgi:sulfopyruvate decarboxylase TPP-binding subunit
MQNAGFANSLSTITSLIDLYEIPLIFVIGWRGFLKNDAPEHEKIGKIQPELLTSIKLKNRVIDETNWKQNCNWALNSIKKNTSVALIVRRDTLG